MINHKIRANRLQRLHDVVKAHVDAKGTPVKLNGVERSFNMGEWDCGTSACALGSYALTPYGKRYWKWNIASVVNEVSRECRLKHHSLRLPDNDNLPVIHEAAFHFGITWKEADFLFMALHSSPDEVLRRIKKVQVRYEAAA